MMTVSYSLAMCALPIAGLVEELSSPLALSKLALAAGLSPDPSLLVANMGVLSPTVVVGGIGIPPRSFSRSRVVHLLPPATPLHPHSEEGGHSEEKPASCSTV